jgi:hypothetical protein
MQWFGKSWGAPVCEATAHVATPIGRACVRCITIIEAKDYGFILPLVGDAGATTAVYHHACFMKSIFGESGKP